MSAPKPFTPEELDQLRGIGNDLVKRLLATLDAERARHAAEVAEAFWRGVTAERAVDYVRHCWESKAAKMRAALAPARGEAGKDPSR